MPKTMAFESVRNIPSSTFLLTTKRKPSTIERTLGRSASGAGASFGSIQIDHSEAANVAASIQYAPLSPSRGDQEAAERGTADRGRARVDALDRVRGGELLRARPGAGSRVVIAGDAEREDAHRERGEHVQRPHARLVERGVQREPDADDARAAPRSTAAAVAGRSRRRSRRRRWSASAAGRARRPRAARPGVSNASARRAGRARRPRRSRCRTSRSSGRRRAAGRPGAARSGPMSMAMPPPPVGGP